MRLLVDRAEWLDGRDRTVSLRDAWAARPDAIDHHAAVAADTVALALDLSVRSRQGETTAGAARQAAQVARWLLADLEDVCERDPPAAAVRYRTLPARLRRQLADAGL